MIRDAQCLETLRKEWEFARSRRDFIFRNAVGSSVLGGHPSLPLMDYCNNLALVFAYSVLQDVLAQLKDEGLFDGKRSTLGALMHDSRRELTWKNFPLVDQGRKARNGIAHDQGVLPRDKCWEYVDAIEQELLGWQVLDGNDPLQVKD